MSGNQSGAEKDNRLLFGEQWSLLLSKSKMALLIFSQSEVELEIQDDWPLRNNGVYCFPNPRWPPQISANQEPNWQFKVATSTKVGHVGKQPTSLDGELGSVSRFSMATRIEQIENRIKKWSKTYMELLPPWLSDARERNGYDSWYIKQDANQAGTVTSSGTNRRQRWRHGFPDPLVRRALSSSPFPFPSHLLRFHARMFNDTVSNSSSSCKGVTRHTKFILKPKIQKFRCYKLDRVLSN